MERQFVLLLLLVPIFDMGPLFSPASPGYPSLPLLAFPIKALLISALYSRCLYLLFLTHLFIQLINLLSATHGRHCTRCKGFRTQRIQVLWSSPSSDGARWLKKETRDEDFERDKGGAEMKNIVAS